MALAALTFAISCYLFAFGGVAFFVAESIWQPTEFFWWVVPVSASIVLVAVAIRLWRHAFVRRRNAWLLGCLVAVLLVTMDFLLFFMYRVRREPDQIDIIWQADSSTFRWGPGEVKIPPGLTHERLSGIDTYVGQFASQDGQLVIFYDIGELAIGHSHGADEVTFPDSGCAHFYLGSSSEEGKAVIDSIAQTYRPLGGTPSWIRPLLPEVLRSDCRLYNRRR